MKELKILLSKLDDSDHKIIQRTLRYPIQVFRKEGRL